MKEFDIAMTETRYRNEEKARKQMHEDISHAVHWRSLAYTASSDDILTGTMAVRLGQIPYDTLPE